MTSSEWKHEVLEQVLRSDDGVVIRDSGFRQAEIKEL